ncbi:MAG: hypothetical protein LBK01_06020 [Burkholderiaceae bacterium]|nr:hypothetical protein [Burkholderiaceae bacterium]
MTETLGDIVSPPVPYLLHGTTVAFSLCDQVWHDGSYIFYGYTNQNNDRIFLWGQSALLRVEISPENAPERTNPFIASLLPSQGKVTWYEDALDTFRDASLFLSEFEKTRGFLLDGTLNKRVSLHYDAKTLAQQSARLADIMRGNLTLAGKARQLAPILSAITHVLTTHRIPDSLKHRESDFYASISALQAQMSAFRDEMHQNAPAADVEPILALEAQIRRIHADFDSILQEQKHIPPDEAAFIQTLLDELAQINALAPGSLSAMQRIPRRLDLCREIWNHPLIDWEVRLSAATQAVDFLSEAVAQMEDAAIKSKKRYATVPDLERHIGAIEQQLDFLESAGVSSLTTPLAEQFLKKTNDWRKGANLLPLTHETFVSSIQLDSVHVTVNGRNTNPDCTIHLSIAGKENALAGHKMYARVFRGKIEEINLLR